jgi:murein DD-endopeptidase MepM/ murein hydrolase activator NlpD
MDRPGQGNDTIVRVAEVDGEPNEYLVTPPQLRAWRRSANAMLIAVGVLIMILGLTWPRSRAYPALLEENMVLKARLLEMERKTSEIDRVLQRLRLYDAQLRSLTEPDGDHGPLPDSAFSNTRVLQAYEQTRPPTGNPEGELDGGEDVELRPEDLRPAETWAYAVQARAESFLSIFEMVEPDLNALMADLETIRALDAALPSHWPSEGSLTSGYGWRRSPIDRRLVFHSGLDIANSRGTPIYAAADGTVIKSGTSGGFGRMVELDHGFGVTSVYAHCTTLRVSEGELVEKGDYIATMGNTGRTTGTHLHFEVRVDGHAMDPLDYLPR